MRRRRVLTWVAVAAVPVIAFGLYWFQPWKLWVDERVDEALPVVASAVRSTTVQVPELTTISVSKPSTSTPAPPSAASTFSAPSVVLEAPSTPVETPVETTSVPVEVTPPPAVGPVRTAAGELISHEHPTTGTASVIVQPDGSRVLTLENLATSNGPDVHVWLAAAPVVAGVDGWYLFDDEPYVDLGPLKGNLGNQVYDIPADVDLAALTSVSLWCERFAVSFGAAALNPV